MDNVNLSGGLKVTMEGSATQQPAPDPDEEARKEAEKEAKESRIAVATALATGVTVLAAALGVFGGLTGAVARMARNFPWLTGIAVSMVVLSVALAITARLIAPGRGENRALKRLVSHEEHRPFWSTWLLWLSGALFAVGVITAVVLLTLTIEKDDRPSVSGQTTREAATGLVSLAGTAKASGLSAEDAVRVVVMPYPEGETDEGTQVYYAVVGPNADGVIDHSFTVILPKDARAAVITAGNDANDSKSADKVCKPAAIVEDPVKAAAPVEGEDSLTACALVSVPEVPPAAPEKKSKKKTGKVKR